MNKHPLHAHLDGIAEEAVPTVDLLPRIRAQIALAASPIRPFHGIRRPVVRRHFLIAACMAALVLTLMTATMVPAATTTAGRAVHHVGQWIGVADHPVKHVETPECKAALHQSHPSMEEHTSTLPAACSIAP